jgi:NADH:ubiquinone oxidoreductase subunit 3 (subunit A)
MFYTLYLSINGTRVTYGYFARLLVFVVCDLSVVAMVPSEISVVTNGMLMVFLSKTPPPFMERLLAH